MSVIGVERDKELVVLVVCHGTGPDQQLCACDLSDIYKQVPTPMHVMFLMFLVRLLCSTRCTDELQQLHRGGGCPSGQCRSGSIQY